MGVLQYCSIQVFLFCCCVNFVEAQPADSLSDTLIVPPGKVPTAKKQFLPAVIKSTAANVVPFTVNYFVRRKSFSFVSLQSILQNLEPRSWEWDVDRFFNNQFSHPYHGSLYFNAFRSEGYNFWQSVPATFGGSLLWEIAGESDKPSINDLLNTTIGGVAWGEMTHRLAQRLTHNRRLGKKRKFLDVVGLVVEPMDGISNLIYRKRDHYLNKTLDSTRIDFEFSGGFRQYNRESNQQRQKTAAEGFSRLRFVYGDGNDLTTPFSNFSVLVEVGTSDSAVFNIARIRGSMTGWQLYQTSRQQHGAVLYLDYDYYHNVAFAYGMQSLQAGLHSRFRRKNLDIQTEAGASLIGLAAVSLDASDEGTARGYDYCTGAGVTVAADLFFFQKFRFRTNARWGWLTTLDGKYPLYRVANRTSSVRYQLSSNLFLQYEWGHFYLQNRRNGTDANHKHNFYKRMGVGYQFSL